jgi:hypothetical protein
MNLNVQQVWRVILGLVYQGKFYYINQQLKLSVIPLSGFQNLKYFYFWIFIST